MAKSGPLLIIEDDEDDVELFRDILKDFQLSNKVMFFLKADEALHFLRTSDESPFLIISDVNLPGMNGLDLKKQIDSDPYLRQKSIPFIFLSTSSNEAAVKKAFTEMVVQGYFEKPILVEDLQKMFHQVIEYWRASCHPY
jgi:CheY-like chemotaxis protein